VLKDSKTGQTKETLCDFNEIITKTGNPKGTFHNCKERGISAFTPEGSEMIDFVTVYNEGID
jgi:hypothetical protein